MFYGSIEFELLMGRKQILTSFKTKMLLERKAIKIELTLESLVAFEATKNDCNHNSSNVTMNNAKETFFFYLLYDI